MPDSNFHSYPHIGISVPNATPFFPILTQAVEEESEVVYALFNQAYLIDYQNLDSATGLNKAWKIQGMDQKIAIEAEDIFFVRIQTDINSSAITNIYFEKKTGSEASDPKFHYAAENISSENAALYKDYAGQFLLPVCEFNKDKKIKTLYLRDNIHWQKINFGNNVEEADMKTTIGVLHNWGNGETFLNNPTVKLRRICQKTNDLGDANSEQVIKIEESPNGENIIITTQFPYLIKDQPVVLHRTRNNTWEWVDMSVGGILYAQQDGDGLAVLPFPTDATEESPYFLSYKGQDAPAWVASETCATGSAP